MTRALRLRVFGFVFLLLGGLFIFPQAEAATYNPLIYPTSGCAGANNHRGSWERIGVKLPTNLSGDSLERAEVIFSDWTAGSNTETVYVVLSTVADPTTTYSANWKTWLNVSASHGAVAGGPGLKRWFAQFNWSAETITETGGGQELTWETSGRVWGGSNYVATGAQHYLTVMTASGGTEDLLIESKSCAGPLVGNNYDYTVAGVSTATYNFRTVGTEGIGIFFSDPPPVDPVRDCVATPTGQTSASVTCTDISADATGYSIFAKAGSSGIGANPMNSSDYSYRAHCNGFPCSVTGLLASTTYYLRVVPTNQFGEGEFSETVSSGDFSYTQVNAPNATSCMDSNTMFSGAAPITLSSTYALVVGAVNDDVLLWADDDGVNSSLPAGTANFVRITKTGTLNYVDFAQTDPLQAGPHVVFFDNFSSDPIGTDDWWAVVTFNTTYMRESGGKNFVGFSLSSAAGSRTALRNYTLDNTTGLIQTLTASPSVCSDPTGEKTTGYLGLVNFTAPDPSGAVSEEFSATTTGPPSGVPFLSGVADPGPPPRHLLSWSSVVGATYYDLNRTDSFGNSLHFQVVGLTYEDGGSTRNKTYSVAACNLIGCGTYSNAVTLRTAPKFLFDDGQLGPDSRAQMASDAGIPPTALDFIFSVILILLGAAILFLATKSPIAAVGGAVAGLLTSIALGLIPVWAILFMGAFGIAAFLLKGD